MPRVETVVSTADDQLSLATYTCPPGDCAWGHRTTVLSHAVVAFAHQPVGIRREGRGQVVADPTRVMLHDPASRFERHQLDPAGDRSTLLVVADERLARLDAPVVDRHGRFRAEHLPTPPGALLRLRLLAHGLAAGEVDPLRTEEVLRAVLLEVLATPLVRPRDSHPSTARRHRRLAEEAREWVAARASGQWVLGDLAADLHASPEHVHRVFRAQTGMSVHEHRDRLRLAAALDMVLDGADDLASVAAVVGYSSHSHLTHRFRRLYGLTPSSVRDRGPAALGPAAGRAPSR